MNHDLFMGVALEEAKRAYECLEVPVGAVLVNEDGEIWARAHNAPISLCDPSAHAEVLSLRQAAKRVGNYRLPGSILYVTLEPCAMCIGAMLQARVKMLVFGASDPKTGAAGSVVDLTKVAVFNHYIEVIRDIRAEECSDLLRLFFQERRLNTSGEVPKWP